MDSRIEDLEKKYWAGDTSPAEERELKEHYRQNPSLSKTGRYFSLLSTKQEQAPAYPFSHPGNNRKPKWWLVAAVVLILMSIGVFLSQEPATQPAYAVEDPAQALEITRASLMMVSEGLNKGKTYSAELNKINQAIEIVK